jgi:hypothetical protein
MIYLISATKGKAEDTNLWKSVKKWQDEGSDDDITLIMYENNTVGLSEVWNQTGKMLAVENFLKQMEKDQ